MYSIPITIKDDMRELNEKIVKFKTGEISFNAFKAFRVPMGIYEQREGNIYMMRIRVAGGIISTEQLKGIANISREHNLKIHITTRQDIQLHDVKLDDIENIYNKLYRIGLTCKGGGGNTVRNITACWGAGICPYEYFNVLPYSIALTDYMLPFQSSYNLPRKLKIAFSGCEKDCAYATMQDLGFISKIKDNNKGFSVYVAGGMGAHSRVAEKIYDFIPEEKVGTIAETVKRLFDKYGNRKNKHKARLRFVIEKMGVEKFKEIFKQQLAEVEEEPEIVLNVKESPTVNYNNIDYQEEFEKNENYTNWEKNNVFKQKTDDLHYVYIRLPLGEIDSDILLKLADRMEKIGIRFLHTTNTQDLIIPYVKEKNLSNIYVNLNELNLTDREKKNINRILTCKGALTCKLGICYSTELGKAVANKLDKENIYLAEHPEINIKISGCPNNCGHHIIGSIGLSGAVRYINSKAMPFYNIYLDGKVAEGETRLGKKYGTVPAKYVPDLVYEILNPYYKDSEKYDNDFYKYINKEEKLLEQTVAKYTNIKEITKEMYYDWGSDTEFTLAGRGVGECGAGVFELIETNINEAEQYLRNRDIINSVVSISRSLLVIRGYDTKDDLKAIDLFVNLFIKEGWVSMKYLPVLEETKKSIQSKVKPNIDEELVKSLIKRVRELYYSLDSNLEFQIPKEEEKNKVEESEEDKMTTKILDLKGVECPINYVKAKLFIEKLPIGTKVEIYLDDGEPIQNVPSSLKDDGQKILKIEKINNHFKVIVEKRV